MKLKDTLVGKDGKLSYRRLTSFVYVVTDLYLLFTDKVDTEIMLHVHYSILVFILIMTGIISAQNIIEFKNGKKNNNDSDSDAVIE